MITVLGAGLTGLSISHHLNNKCILYEKNTYAGGHIHSEYIDGFTWDEGPHVSFTNNEYVKKLFEYNTNNEVLAYPVKTTNYFKGSWIPHPAQSNLFAVPQPLRDYCLKDFLTARKNYPNDFVPQNYAQWLDFSFGSEFSKTFPSAYTRKYWTTDPLNMTTNWVGSRVFFPDIEIVKQGYLAPPAEETHYVKNVRYPKYGGYISFAKKMIEKANVQFNASLAAIDFSTKRITFTNGNEISFDKLVSTIPLPILIEKSNAPSHIKKAASELNCTSALLINVTAGHTTQRPENWIYVYDEDKYSTRINCTELLSPYNAPLGKTGIQVEVYFSRYRPIMNEPAFIAKKVCEELIEMGLIQSQQSIETVHTKWIQWANIIYDHAREEAQNTILKWLEGYGLMRETDDLAPMTDWESRFADPFQLGDIILAGRFGQWKYYWTDDCILRGLLISKTLKKEHD